jgi:hypothetical protein
MCNNEGPLRDLILCQCKGLRKLFKSILQRKPRRSLEFVNRIGAIEGLIEPKPRQAQTLQEANRLLGALIDDLKTADDGAGDFIHNGERHTESIACDISV